MATQLNYVVAQEKLADLARSSERARLTQDSRSVESASRGVGAIARLLVPRRLRVAATVTGAPVQRDRYAEDCVR
jgi:hypothetical protein